MTVLMVFVHLAPALALTARAVPDEKLPPAAGAAVDAAFQRLMDRVLAVPLVSGRTVSDVLAVFPAIECRFRDQLRATVPPGPVELFVDGSARTTLCLSTTQLARLINTVVTEALPAIDPSQLAIDQATAGVRIEVMARVTAPADGQVGLRGWRHCPPDRRDTVRRAATIDLATNLEDQIGQWRLSPYQKVRHVWARLPAFHRACRAVFARIPSSTPDYSPAGVCRIEARLSRADVITLLVESAAPLADRLEVDLTQAIDPRFRDPLVAVGFAVPGPSASGTSNEPGQDIASAPAWTSDVFHAQAEGAPPADVAEAATRRRLALTAADLDARRKLWLRIETLPLPGGKSLAVLLQQSPRAHALADAIDAVMLTVEEPAFRDDDKVALAMQVHGLDVWRAVVGSPIRTITWTHQPERTARRPSRASSPTESFEPTTRPASIQREPGKDRAEPAPVSPESPTEPMELEFEPVPAVSITQPANMR